MFAPREMNFRGTELFPDVMHPPPVVRLTVMVDHAVDDGHLRNTALAYIQMTKGTIMGFWNGQRQSHMLSGLTQWQKNLLIPTFGATLLMTYVGAQGMNEMWLKLNLSEYVSNPAITGDPLCLLVLSNGNTVTAIPMSGLRGSPVYSAKLKASAWGTDILPTSQLKLEQKFSAILWPLQITNNILASSTTFCFTTTAAGRSLQGCAVGTTALDDPNNWDGADHAKIYPIFNGGAGSYYASFDDFSVDREGRITTTPTSVSDATPYAIGPDGKRYYAASASGSYTSHIQTLRQALGAGWDAQYPPRSPDPSSNYYYDGSIQYFVDGDLHLKYGYTSYAEHSPPLEPVPWTRIYARTHETMGVPWPIYSRAGGLDHLEIRTPEMSIDSEDEDFQAAPEHSFTFHGATVSYLGQTFTDPSFVYTSGPFPNYVKIGYLLEFPFSLGTTNAFIADPSSPVSNTFADTIWSTPYGKFGSNLKPWLHVSNGHHYIQGFTVGGARKIFLDGAPLNIKVKGDIQTVLMDIPLSRIKQLK